MNIQEFINTKRFLTELQELSLYTLLSYKCTQGIKREIKNLLRYQFYSKFDGRWFGKHFIVKDDYIEYVGKDKDISQVRKELLGDKE